MSVVSVQKALSGDIDAGSQVTVRGWVRTRRDSKAGLSFVNVSDGSCFAPIQVVASSDLPNYESEVKKLTAGKKEKPSPAGLIVDYAQEAARDLGNTLGRGCRIVSGKKKGRIELEFYGVDDLNELLEALHTIKKP